MNRTLLFGIALFLGVMGIALTGAEKQAAAGHRCHGCNAACSGDCGGEAACNGCHKRCHRDRCHGRCHRDRCHGRCHKKCNGCNADCGGSDCGAGEVKEAPKDAPKDAPKSTSIEENAPLAFRSVSFVR